jgi:putative tryptophan/tyrosine transport system substrate-binding protein
MQHRALIIVAFGLSGGYLLAVSAILIDFVSSTRLRPVSYYLLGLSVLAVVGAALAVRRPQAGRRLLLFATFAGPGPLAVLVGLPGFFLLFFGIGRLLAPEPKYLVWPGFEFLLVALCALVLMMAWGAAWLWLRAAHEAFEGAHHRREVAPNTNPGGLRLVARRPVVLGMAVGAVGLALLTVLATMRLVDGQRRPLKVSRIGIIYDGSGSPSGWAGFTAALRELGYADGLDIIIERRPFEAPDSELTAYAAELVALPVDLLVVSGAQAIQAAMDATNTIPIVMSIASDPVPQDFVASLTRPGGNLTGLRQADLQLTRKQLELLKDTVPGLTRVAILWNPAIRDRAHEVQETEAAAQILGLRVQSLEARNLEELETAVEAAAAGAAGALLLQTSSLHSRGHARIIELAAQNRLPTLSGYAEFVADGGLMAYGPSLGASNRRAASFVDKILKGAKPVDLPVEQPMRFDFVINLQTAHGLGLTIPPHVLSQATELI